ncbi:MAG TPA: type I methionyl aminopeptidase, partial [Roseovarius sp.]|nr:type I methionyl aminopeptidase [Roseovarius sp.]
MSDHKGRITRDGIRIHEAADFAGMHKAGALAAQIL